MPAKLPFDDLLARLRAGDHRAASVIYRRYAAKLIDKARRALPRAIRKSDDAEDVVQSVLATFFRRVQAGQFELDGWESIDALLVLITLRKCGHRVEHFVAARRDVRLEVSPDEAAGISASFWLGLARDPEPSEAVMLAELMQNLLNSLEDERHRRMLQMRLEGHTIGEIAKEVERSKRMVHRVLDKVKQRLERWLERG